MGGTMDWARLRNRNGFTHRQMEGDPGYGSLVLLEAEMNRLEQSMMGVYASHSDVPGSDHLIREAAKATGLSQRSVKKVLRWFLGLPEPRCKGCKAVMTRSNGLISQRCAKHLGYEVEYPGAS